MDFRRAFVRKSLLPKLVQRRTTPSRRRQRYHQGQRTPWIRTSCTVVKGKHDQTSLRTRRYTVAIVDFTDRHGDSPNDLPHLMSQQLVLITNETTPAQGACCGTTQFVWLLWFFWTHSSNWQSESDSHTHFFSVLSSDAHVTVSAHKNFHGLRSVWKVIPSSHHFADLLSLCATDYNFHCHDLTFSAPCWFFVGTLG